MNKPTGQPVSSKPKALLRSYLQGQNREHSFTQNVLTLKACRKNDPLAAETWEQQNFEHSQ